MTGKRARKIAHIGPLCACVYIYIFIHAHMHATKINTDGREKAAKTKKKNIHAHAQALKINTYAALRGAKRLPRQRRSGESWRMTMRMMNLITV
jgi:hypothetical protein